jgi:hypothetical protein
MRASKATVLCGGRSVMSVPTAISEMSSQIIPSKLCYICGETTEFRTWRPLAFELQRRGYARGWVGPGSLVAIQLLVPWDTFKKCSLGQTASAMSEPSDLAVSAC